MHHPSDSFAAQLFPFTQIIIYCNASLPLLQGPVIRPNVQLTPLRGGYLTGRPAVVDFGTALNLTRVQLGFNVNVSAHVQMTCALEMYT